MSSDRLRVAFVGKGGSGKSTVAGTFARLLARRGHPVLVLDSDPMPGLAATLGMTARDEGLPDEAVEEAPDERPPYRLSVDPVTAVERFAARGPDGLRLLQLGKLRGHASTMLRSQIAFRRITEGLGGTVPWHLVGDLPAGTRQPFFGWGSYADTVVVVVEPSIKSLLSARRLTRLADVDDAPRLVAVANKVREDGDVDRIAARIGLEVVASLPWDEAIVDADREGRPLVEVAPDGPAVAALESLIAALGVREAR